MDSKANSREPSIGHFNMQDPMRASLRSSKSAAPFISNPAPAKSSPVKAKKPGSKLTKPVGRSVSSVSGKRPAYLNADVVHIPLKGDSVNSLPQQQRTEGYSQSSTISVELGWIDALHLHYSWLTYQLVRAEWNWLPLPIDKVYTIWSAP